MNRIFAVILLIGLSVNVQAQRYKPGSVSIINAKGKNLTETYNKIQIGVLAPGIMPARKNLWYAKTRNPSVQGITEIIPITFRYAWSSNINTEFIVQADYESASYYDKYLVDQTTHRRQFYTLSIGFNYKWWNYKLMTLYSGLTIGGGYSRYHVSKNDILATYPDEVDRTNWIYPAAQLTVVGATWGRKFGGFGELAFGSKGIVNFGMYLKL